MEGLKATMTTTQKKSEAAATLGSLGGRARARSLNPEQRTKAARKAAKARWANHTPSDSTSAVSHRKARAEEKRVKAKKEK